MDRCELEHLAGFRIFQMGDIMKRNVMMSMRLEGVDEVTLMHCWIIRYLSENKDKDVFQRDIEKQFRTPRSSVTGILQVMEKKGYLRRESVERDARLKKVMITEAGEELHMKFENKIHKLNREMLEGFSDEDLLRFAQVSERIVEQMEQIKAELGGEL